MTKAIKLSTYDFVNFKYPEAEMPKRIFDANLNRLKNHEIAADEAAYFLGNTVFTHLSSYNGDDNLHSCMKRTSRILDVLKSSNAAFDSGVFLEAIAHVIKNMSFSTYVQKHEVEWFELYDLNDNFEIVYVENSNSKVVDFVKTYFGYLLDNLHHFDINNSRTREDVSLLMMVHNSGNSDVEFLRWLVTKGADPHAISSTHGGLGSFTDLTFVKYLGDPTRWINKIEYLRSLGVDIAERSPVGGYFHSERGERPDTPFEDLFAEVDSIESISSVLENKKALDYFGKLKLSNMAMAASQDIQCDAGHSDNKRRVTGRGI